MRQYSADSGKDQTPYTGLHFELKNLLGGHSGEEIDKQRANAIHLFGRLLSAACEQDEIYLVRAAGGVADNAIPTSVTADLLVKEGEAESLKAYFAAKAKALLDKGITINKVNGKETLLTIAPADGSYKVNFGKEEFETYFKNFLRPQLIEMLF